MSNSKLARLANMVCAYLVLAAVLLFVPACSGQVEPQARQQQLGFAGVDVIRVVPTGNAIDDVENVRSALRDVATGGTVRLAAGTFRFGTSTVLIERSVRIEGVGDGDEIETIIEGGGAPGFWGVECTALSAVDLPSGPFRVSVVDGSGPVAFSRLWFRRWLAQAIYVDGCDGLSVTGCRFTEPVARPAHVALGLTMKEVSGLSVTGPRARGGFVFTDNEGHFARASYQGNLPDDEQLAALLFTAFDDIRIERNRFDGNDDGLEVVGNKRFHRIVESFPGCAAVVPPVRNPDTTITIADNSFHLDQLVSPVWPTQSGLVVLGNENGKGQTLVERNHLSIGGAPLSFAVSLSGERQLVRDNYAAFRILDAGAGLVRPTGFFLLGFGVPFPGLGPVTLGGSLFDSVIVGNVATGTVSGPTVFFYDPGFEINESQGNEVSLNGSIEALAEASEPAPALTLFVSQYVHGNTFEGHCGIVVDLNGHNTYIGKNCSP